MDDPTMSTCSAPSASTRAVSHSTPKRRKPTGPTGTASLRPQPGQSGITSRPLSLPAINAHSPASFNTPCMSSTGSSPSPPTKAAVRCPSELVNHAVDVSKPCDLNSSSRCCSNARRRESSLISILPRTSARLGRVHRPCRTYCPFRAWNARPRAAQNDASASRRTHSRTGVRASSATSAEVPFCACRRARKRRRSVRVDVYFLTSGTAPGDAEDGVSVAAGRPHPVGVNGQQPRPDRTERCD